MTSCNWNNVEGCGSVLHCIENGQDPNPEPQEQEEEEEDEDAPASSGTFMIVYVLLAARVINSATILCPMLHRVVPITLNVRASIRTAGSHGTCCTREYSNGTGQADTNEGMVHSLKQRGLISSESAEKAFLGK